MLGSSELRCWNCRSRSLEEWNTQCSRTDQRSFVAPGNFGSFVGNPQRATLRDSTRRDCTDPPISSALPCGFQDTVCCQTCKASLPTKKESGFEYFCSFWPKDWVYLADRCPNTIELDAKMSASQWSCPESREW
jgi:hypothetical protein